MRREELDELHYITPIANAGSIQHHGILSHRRASRLQHDSVAMPEIQDRRKNVVVPGGRRLHEYVNLYICARNPMLYKRRGQHSVLAVLRISTDVLDLPGAVVTDGNASSDYTRFSEPRRGLERIDRSLVFAKYWTHPGDEIAEWRHKSAKCAEVLIPECVLPNYIVGAYVSTPQARDELSKAAPGIDVTLNASLFFQ